MTDNAGAMVKAVDRMIKKSVCSMHVPCLTHTIQLCIHDGISSVTEVQTLIARCREIVGLFNHSVIMTETMKVNQIQNNKPV